MTRVLLTLRLRLRALLRGPAHLVGIAWLAHAAAASASTHVYDVLLDLDASAATGCTLATPREPISDIERVLRVSVTTHPAARRCVGRIRRDGYDDADRVIQVTPPDAHACV